MGSSVGSDVVAPGALIGIEVDGTKLALANVEGTVYAIDDTCPHQGCPLSLGTLEGAVVTCTCHGSQFDVRTGEVVRSPAEDPVQTYEVEMENGELKIRG